MTEMPPIGWWLYSHLPGEEFPPVLLSSLAGGCLTPPASASCLQPALPQGLRRTDGDTWPVQTPCSSGALQPNRGHLLGAGSWHSKGFGLGRNIFTLYSFSAKKLLMEKPNNLFSPVTTACQCFWRSPPSSAAGYLYNTFL